jgi:Flp pilus assembly pilin Flp
MQSPKAVARLMELANNGWREEDGQDLVEYGLLMALIAIVALGAVSTFGQIVFNVFWNTIANNF